MANSRTQNGGDNWVQCLNCRRKNSVYDRDLDMLRLDNIGGPPSSDKYALFWCDRCKSSKMHSVKSKGKR